MRWLPDLRRPLEAYSIETLDVVAIPAGWRVAHFASPESWGPKTPYGFSALREWRDTDAGNSSPPLKLKANLDV